MRIISIIFSIVLLTCVNDSYAQNPIVQSLLNDVRLDSLTNFVKQLSGKKAVVINGVTDTIKSRQYQQPGNEKAFQFMKAEFVRFGYQVDSFQFNSMGKNLLAIKTGYKYPNKRFMLGAHYDNWPVTTVAPGADDNASGTSTVLEAGRVFGNYLNNDWKISGVVGGIEAGFRAEFLKHGYLEFTGKGGYANYINTLVQGRGYGKASNQFWFVEAILILGFQFKA